MAKLRSNHSKNKNPFVGLGIRVFVAFLFIVGLFFFAYRKFSTVSTRSDTYDEIEFDRNEVDRDYLPRGSKNTELIHHKYYSLAYNEEYEIAEWASYLLTRAELEVKNVKRWKGYEFDNTVSTRSAHYRDYSNSGYTRGHLVPAGDMAFSKQAMKETFFMSNIAPQKKVLNNGIWKELEESVRDWAYDNDELYIVTGPVMDGIEHYIGKNRVGVPLAFYKAILDNSGRTKKGIAFIIPHSREEKHLREYAMSIDDLEAQINLDLYPDLLEEDEERIESTYDISDWDFSEKRYKLRINKWNNE